MIRPLLVLTATLVPLSAQAGDATAGKKRATACQTCHGMDGLSKLPEAPNLAGQVEPYLVKALTEYRDGKRHYLDDLPLTWRYVIGIARRYAETAPLADLLERALGDRDITQPGAGAAA